MTAPYAYSAKASKKRIRLCKTDSMFCQDVLAVTVYLDHDFVLCPYGYIFHSKIRCYIFLKVFSNIKLRIPASYDAKIRPP